MLDGRTTMTDPIFDLNEAFRATTATMLARFQGARKLTAHPTTLGSGAEQDWKTALEQFLPRRFAVDPAFVVDRYGHESDQMDLVIHDRNFSPMFWTIDQTLFLPAECVYAVLEVKPELNKEYLIYAGDKAASVRRLHRTSGPIPQLAQPAAPAKPKRILAGIVAARSGWTSTLASSPLVDVMKDLTADRRIDFGCALDSGMFEVPEDGDVEKAEHAGADVGLAMFAMRLAARLTAMGTVPALDYGAYTDRLTQPLAEPEGS